MWETCCSLSSASVVRPSASVNRFCRMSIPTWYGQISRGYEDRMGNLCTLVVVVVDGGLIAHPVDWSTFSFFCTRHMFYMLESLREKKTNLTKRMNSHVLVTTWKKLMRCVILIHQKWINDHSKITILETWRNLVWGVAQKNEYTYTAYIIRLLPGMSSITPKDRIWNRERRGGLNLKQ